MNKKASELEASAWKFLKLGRKREAVEALYEAAKAADTVAQREVLRKRASLVQKECIAWDETGGRWTLK